MHELIFRQMSFIVLSGIIGWGVLVQAEDADYPQWRGPARDGHGAPQSLMQQWPDSGPEVSWTFTDAGTGYASVAIFEGNLLTMGDRDGQCQVICLDAKTGLLKWNTSIDRASTDNDYTHRWGGGPRSTPTINGEHVYALSDRGTLACLTLDQGNKVWSVDFLEQYQGTIPRWGYSESVLIDEDRVIATPGGKHFMVALEKKTGKEIWSSRGLETQAQYASVLKHTLGATSFYVTASQQGVVAFDSESGEKLFEAAETGNSVAVIPTPVVQGNLLYHTSAYNAGNVLLQLQQPRKGSITAQLLYHLSNKSMQNHHGGVVLVKNVIYGFSKASGGQWMAQDLKSGDTLWTKKLRGNQSGSICYADGRLYCYNDSDGSLYLLRPSRDRWHPEGKLILPSETKLPRGRGAIWAHPVVANGQLFLRDQDLIFAFDIAR